MSQASVSVGGQPIGEIAQGVLLFVGIEKADIGDDDDPEGATHIDWLVRKIIGLRLFADDDERMNRSLVDIDGNALVISQFTLHARTKKGTRPSFDQAAPPAEAEQRYNAFVAALSTALGKPIATGKFGAMMDVALVNDGPVTLILDSRRRE